MKAGLVAARELTDVARETALMQENSAKVVLFVFVFVTVFAAQVYTRISKQLGSNTQTGSFQPMLAALKASAEKLATIHTSTLAKVMRISHKKCQKEAKFPQKNCEEFKFNAGQLSGQ